MLVASCGIFHRRRRKIVALISLKVRAGIAALPLGAAAGDAMTVMATPRSEIVI
jgi:hypothetical protein